MSITKTEYKNLKKIINEIITYTIILLPLFDARVLFTESLKKLNA